MITLRNKQRERVVGVCGWFWRVLKTTKLIFWMDFESKKFSPAASTSNFATNQSTTDLRWFSNLGNRGVSLPILHQTHKDIITMQTESAQGLAGPVPLSRQHRTHKRYLRCWDVRLFHWIDSMIPVFTCTRYYDVVSLRHSGETQESVVSWEYRYFR